MGTVVTGRTHTGILGLPDCKGHGLFRLTSRPHKAEISNSGFQQACRCITCGQEYSRVDCEFLKIKATREQIREVLRHVTKARNALLKARREYNEILEAMGS